jgi:hypothetical protein
VVPVTEGEQLQHANTPSFGTMSSFGACAVAQTIHGPDSLEREPRQRYGKPNLILSVLYAQEDELRVS